MAVMNTHHGLSEVCGCAIMWAVQSGRGADRLARLHGVQEVPGSIPGAPTYIETSSPCLWGVGAFFIQIRRYMVGINQRSYSCDMHWMMDF